MLTPADSVQHKQIRCSDPEIGFCIEDIITHETEGSAEGLSALRIVSNQEILSGLNYLITSETMIIGIDCHKKDPAAP